MTKTGLQLLPPSLPGYIGSPDTTFAGSRNGLSTLIWWTYISTHDYEAQVKKLIHCLELTIYAKDQLTKVEEDRGRCEDLWISHSPLSLSVRFKKPNDDIVYKYTLANETLTLDTKDGLTTRTYTHIYLMGSTTKEKLWMSFLKPCVHQMLSQISKFKFNRCRLVLCRITVLRKVLKISTVAFALEVVMLVY